MMGRYIQRVAMPKFIGSVHIGFPDVQLSHTEPTTVFSIDSLH